MTEITNIDAIIELIMREARSRTKSDHSRAVLEVLSELTTRCNEILDKFPFYKKSINHTKRGGD